MITEISPSTLTEGKKRLMKGLSECQQRAFLANEAIALGRHGVRLVSQFFGVSKQRIYRGIHDVKHDLHPPGERIRRPGGGRKPLLASHPEWIEAFKKATEDRTAGLPQDGDVIWVSMTIPQIAKAMCDAGCKVSAYTVRQIARTMGFRHRSFIKSLTMKEVKDRDAQFRFIAMVREEAAKAGLPVISIDTKKKEYIGWFKRFGKQLAKGQPKAYDHDFASFANGQIVPQGVYDIVANIVLLTIGISHDTSAFVCENIQRAWETFLRDMYPGATTLFVLADGGGSNSSSHRIVKQDLMKLAERLKINIVMLHYPPYCSKHNPIEHRVFSHITRSWAGAPLLSVEDAAKRAASTTTSKGLVVNVHIDRNKYDINRPIDDDYEKKLAKRVVFATERPQWNYLVKWS